MNRKRPFGYLQGAVWLAVLMMTGGQQAMAADDEESNKGSWKVDFRYRLETVDQKPLPKDALTSTLRTRLNYTSPTASGFSFFGEFDYVAEVFADDFNAGGGNTPDRAQYPVVADPDGPDLNQAFLQYKNGGSQFRAGRQRIILDNARFVGNVGWRQNEQTYDALSFVHQADNKLKFTAAYIDRVNRIFGRDVDAGDHDNSTFLLNVNKYFGDGGLLTGYWYDIDNEDALALSNRTIGLRYAASRTMNDRKIGYTFEFASQIDSGDNPVAYDANYYRVDLSAGLGAATIYAGFESLEGDANNGGQAFRTPLATLHAFNGWADKFLATPAAGLEDTFIGVKGVRSGWSWNVLYHQYSAQSGSADFGCELDASLATKFSNKLGLLLKLASFDSSHAAYGDTTKVWVQLTAGF
jgi:hypothetical protein